jgi:phosphinothricin acetyltransferase
MLQGPVEEHMSGEIRLADEGCAEGIRAIYAPIVESTAISFETEAPDAGEIAGRVRGILQAHPWLVCEGEGGIEGFAYGSVFRAPPGPSKT